jgi:hypothetical protein
LEWPAGGVAAGLLCGKFDLDAGGEDHGRGVTVDEETVEDCGSFGEHGDIGDPRPGMLAGRPAGWVGADPIRG